MSKWKRIVLPNRPKQESYTYENDSFGGSFCPSVQKLDTNSDEMTNRHQVKI